MGATRWIPDPEDSEFPSDAARIWLEERGGMSFTPVDFEALLARGRSVGWTGAMLAEHERMAERGRCFDFVQDEAPFLRGTLWEDNVYFLYLDADHEAGCRSLIVEGGRVLEVGLYEH